MAGLLAAGLTGLAACGSVSSLPGHRANALRQLQIVTTPDANLKTATPIDVVWVFDAATLARLPATAREWFQNRPALQAGLAGHIAVSSWEMPPGSAVHGTSLPSGHEKAAAVLVFVSSVGPVGWDRVRLGEDRCSRITVHADRVDHAPC